MVSDTRAQAFTLEGFVAALLLLATVAFVLNATAVTPLSSSTSSQHAETQGEGLVAGLVDGAAMNDTLRPTLLYWNNSSKTFHNVTTAGTYSNCDGLPTAFGTLLNRSLYDQGWACNVNVRYVNATTGAVTTQPIVNSGTPSDNAVRAARTVTLYDDDRLYFANGTLTDTTLGNATEFYVSDVDDTSGLYAVVEVEVIAWRA